MTKLMILKYSELQSMTNRRLKQEKVSRKPNDKKKDHYIIKFKTKMLSLHSTFFYFRYKIR